jgi:hypothetical protein
METVRIHAIDGKPEQQVLSIRHDGLATLTSWERGGYATFHFEQDDGLIPALKEAIEEYEASNTLEATS